ncbi:hypothetical protein T09_14383 [Trichinella sp. T9]|nr:hypothetical protein T09_14383 [Trichinella sp. T9]
MYRKRAQKFPRLPPTRQQLEIPPQWRMTKSDRRFLLYNNVYNSILIFCTEENLSVLSEHSVWSMSRDQRKQLQQRITASTAECNGGTRTLEQFLRAVAYLIKNKKYEELQQRITALTAEYNGGTRTLEQFLRAVAYLVPEGENY